MLVEEGRRVGEVFVRDEGEEEDGSKEQGTVEQRGYWMGSLSLEIPRKGRIG